MNATRTTRLLVIPTYNEAGNLERLVEAVHRLGLGLDLLVVDDHSPDGTGALAELLAARLPLAVLHRSGKLGIGSAHKDGLRYAIERGYTHVLTMDADLSHSPAYLGPMLARAAEADVVLGSRYVQGGGFHRFAFHRLLLTKIVHRLTTVLLGLPYDCTGGLRCYRVAALRRLDMAQVPSDGHAFLIEILFALTRLGCAIVEYPIVFQPREQGCSKVSAAELHRSAWALTRLALQRRDAAWMPAPSLCAADALSEKAQP